MKEIQSNINIVGGGLIGAVTAYSLSKLGNNVVVLEQNAKFNHKNILDRRTTAISEGTKKFLDFYIFPYRSEIVESIHGQQQLSIYPAAESGCK